MPRPVKNGPRRRRPGAGPKEAAPAPPPAAVPGFWNARRLGAAGEACLWLVLGVPLAVLARDAFRGGWENFWNALTLPAAAAALRLTLWTAALVAAVNAVMGTLAAYALDRLEFPGKRFVNALVDLPFAVPGFVAGAVLAVLYGPAGGRSAGSALFSSGGVVLALLFVCLPLGVRSVQPFLMAARDASTAPGVERWDAFRRATLPVLMPGIVAGALLSFARSLGELGAVLLVSGSVPLRSQTAAVYVLGEVESGNRLGASAVSVVLVLASFLLALAAGAWRSRAGERRP